MVIFDKLVLSDDRTKLLIDAHISDASYYDDRFIEGVYIDTQETVLEHFDNPSDNPIYTYKPEINVKERTVHLEITKAMMPTFTGDFSKTLFFVFIKTKGTFPSNTPCGQDNPYTLGVTFDEALVYNKVMQYVKEVSKDCEIPKGFIDLILRLETLKISLKTKHYAQAEKMFNLLISNIESKQTVTCNCNGRSVI